MSTEFKQEERYVVFKLSDVEEHFTPGEKQQLARLVEVQRVGREEAGKPLLRCVVVEKDWPEYEPTWKAIEARVTGTQNALEEIAMYRKARDERDTLRAAVRHEADCVDAAKAEIDALRAKIEEMEKQEPVGWQRLYRDGSGSEDFTDLPHVFERQRPLYALPGAQPAPSVPDAWKKDLFLIKHAMAMNNWNWNSEASDDLKREAYAAIKRLLAAAPEVKP